MMRVKNIFSVSLIIIGVVLTVLALPLAIKFFFRIFHLLLVHPLESLSFFGLATAFLTVYIYLDEAESKG